ncbi:MAG: AsmA family protein [Desulfobacterales bacterium]|jgi:AsmA protein
MKKALKWGGIIFVGLVVVVIAALLIIPMFVDLQKYKPKLEKYVSETTGRPFAIGNKLKLSLFPWAGVYFSDLHLGNTSGFAEKDFLTLKSFEVRVKLLPLISKNIQIKRFVINEPRVSLVKNKDGGTNWDFSKGIHAKEGDAKKEKDAEAPADKTPKMGLPISTMTIGDLSIKNGVVLWIDHSTNTRKEVSDINLTVKDAALDRPVQLAFSAQMDKKPLSVEGSVGPLDKGLEGGGVPLDLSVSALKELSMRLKGNLENPVISPALNMDIEVAEFSPRKLVAALEQPFPIATADPKALNRVALKAHVQATAENVSISSGLLDLDDSKLNFNMQASEFSRPAIKFDLNLDQINLDRYRPPSSEEKPAAETSAQPAAAKKTQKTDYTPLRRLIMDGQLKIGKLIVSKAKIQDVLLKVTAKNGIINLDPLQLKLYQGGAGGKAALNVQQDVPKSNLDLNVNNIQINPLLKDVLQKDILEGTTNAKLSLSMVGDDPVSIKKSLNGEGKFMFNDGAIIGIDLAGMARNIKTAFGGEKVTERPKTDFTELLAPFSIKNGVVNTPQSSLKSPLLRIIAAGNADLINETLDFRVEPKAVGTLKGQGDETQRSGIMVPVLVSGTFAAPKFRPDLKAAATQELQEKVLESEKVKKLLDKGELKPLEEKTKEVLKSILGQ